MHQLKIVVASEDSECKVKSYQFLVGPLSAIQPFSHPLTVITNNQPQFFQLFQVEQIKNEIKINDTFQCQRCKKCLWFS